jgi:hypothetical protein
VNGVLIQRMPARNAIENAMQHTGNARSVGGEEVEAFWRLETGNTT